MKLDRNQNKDGIGKYALLKLRKLEDYRTGLFGGIDGQIEHAFKVLEDAGILDWGNAGSESEFFVIRLKDKYARDALHAYSSAAVSDDPQWAAEVMEMAERAGPRSPFCKRPD